MTQSTDSDFVTERSTGLRYGLMLGLVSIVYFLVINLSGMDPTQGWQRWAGMIFNVGFLVLAHLYFREHNQGFMSFGQGLSISFWIGLFSALLAVTISALYLFYVDPASLERMQDLQRQGMEDQGLSEEQIDQGMQMAAKFMTPGFFIAFGLIGNVVLMLLTGLLITLFTQRADTRMPE